MTGTKLRLRYGSFALIMFGPRLAMGYLSSPRWGYNLIQINLAVSVRIPSSIVQCTISELVTVIAAKESPGLPAAARFRVVFQLQQHLTSHHRSLTEIHIHKRGDEAIH